MYLDKFCNEVSINGELICDFIEDHSKSSDFSSDGLHFGTKYGDNFKENKAYKWLYDEPIEDEFKVIEETTEDEFKVIEETVEEDFDEAEEYDIEANF